MGDEKGWIGRGGNDGRREIEESWPPTVGVSRCCIAATCDFQIEKSHQSGAMSPAIVVACILTLLYLCCHLATANPDAKRLYDDLLRKKKYQKLMRPVADHRNNLTVSVNLKLSQLIDVVSFFQNVFK